MSPDLSDDKLKFVKDIVTMSNRPPGGYLLIGVDDAGTPCMPIGKITNRSKFDGANLGQLVRGYIEGEIHLRVQIHEHEGNEIVMIFVPHHLDGLPVPFSKIGQYPNPGGKADTVVFRPGEILVREGPANVPIRHAHWQDILSVYASKIRAEAGDTAQQLLREFLNVQQHSGDWRGNVPLLMDMDDSNFAAATTALLEAGNDVRLRQFIRSFGQIVDTDDYELVLNKWTIFCAQVLYFERSDLADEAISRVWDAYSRLGVGEAATRKRLAVVIRIYVLGGLAVRLENWPTVTSLALRPVPVRNLWD